MARKDPNETKNYNRQYYLQRKDARYMQAALDLQYWLQKNEYSMDDLADYLKANFMLRRAKKGS